jgi:hypothetical protein
MNESMVRGSITDVETGESHEVEHFLLVTGSELTAMVKITQIESYVHENESFQVSVNCLALDSFGFVFQLNMNFTPDFIEERDKLLRELKVDSLFIVKGHYTVAENMPPFITLHDPSYRTVPPEISEVQVRRAFEVNKED